MRKAACLFVALALLGRARAEEGPAPREGLRLLKPPKGVTLNAEQQRLLDQANDFVAKAHELLVKHEPGLAVHELRKALTIKNQLEELKPEKQPAGKGIESSDPGTPADKIETEGGLEALLEIAESGGMAAPPDVDSGLYKRKILKSVEDEAKKLQAKQQQLTQDLQAAATTGGGGAPDSKTQPKAQQAGGEPGQPEPGGQPGKQEAGGQPGKAEAGGEKAVGSRQEAVGGKAEAKADAAGPPNPQSSLAAREDEIGKELGRLGSKLGQVAPKGEGPNRLEEAFRGAATAAAQTAQQIRKGDLAGAATASQQVERAIQSALAEAGLATTATLEEALAAIERQTAKLQAKQQAVLDQTQEIGKAAGGGPASERTKAERTRGLAGEQARLKPQVEGLQGALEDLAASAGSPNPAARTAENAAKEEIAGAAAALRSARAPQAVVNAAVRLTQGDTGAASKAMTQVQAGLSAAREHLAAADAALAGDAARLERALRAVRQMTAEARRIEKTALVAAGQEAVGSKQEAVGSPKSGKQDTAGQPGKAKASGQPPISPDNQQSAIENRQSQVSPSWGQVLNKAAQQLNEEVARAVQRLRLPSVLPEPSQQLLKAASRPAAFERDFSGSLSKVRSLLAALEKVEVELRRKVGHDADNKALRSYSRERIPSAYRKAVADYYEELSKGE